MLKCEFESVCECCSLCGEQQFAFNKRAKDEGGRGRFSARILHGSQKGFTLIHSATGVAFFFYYFHPSCAQIIYAPIITVKCAISLQDYLAETMPRYNKYIINIQFELHSRDSLHVARLALGAPHPIISEQDAN